MDPKGVYDQILKRSFPDISRKGTNLYTLSSGTQKYLITEVKENELTPKKRYTTGKESLSSITPRFRLYFQIVSSC